MAKLHHTLMYLPPSLVNVAESLAHYGFEVSIGRGGLDVTKSETFGRKPAVTFSLEENEDASFSVIEPVFSSSIGPGTIRSLVTDIIATSDRAGKDFHVRPSNEEDAKMWQQNGFLPHGDMGSMRHRHDPAAQIEIVRGLSEADYARATEEKGIFRPEPCACGSSACADWHVSGVADYQGVKFTQEQAEAVAAALNGEIVPDPEAQTGPNTFSVSRCACGDPVCQHYHVTGASVQGVRFSEAQAKLAVVALEGWTKPAPEPETGYRP